MKKPRVKRKRGEENQDKKINKKQKKRKL